MKKNTLLSKLKMLVPKFCKKRSPKKKIFMPLLAPLFLMRQEILSTLSSICQNR